MAGRATPRQGDLFSEPIGTGASGAGEEAAPRGPELLPLQRRQLLDWQERLRAFQSPRFEAVARGQ